MRTASLDRQLARVQALPDVVGGWGGCRRASGPAHQLASAIAIAIIRIVDLVSRGGLMVEFEGRKTLSKDIDKSV